MVVNCFLKQIFNFNHNISCSNGHASVSFTMQTINGGGMQVHEDITHFWSWNQGNLLQSDTFLKSNLNIHAIWYDKFSNILVNNEFITCFCFTILFHKFSQFWHLHEKRKQTYLVLVQKSFFSQFVSWNRNYNKYSLNKFVDSEFEIGKNIWWICWKCANPPGIILVPQMLMIIKWRVWSSKRAKSGQWSSTELLSVAFASSVSMEWPPNFSFKASLRRSYKQESKFLYNQLIVQLYFK